jgi:hypothetical protein
MLQFFRKNQQAFIVFVIVYCFTIIITCYSLIFTKHSFPELFHFLSFANLGKFMPANRVSGLILTFFAGLGIIFAGFYLVRININYLIIQKRTQFPAFFLVAISSFAFHIHLFSTAIVASLFLLLAIDRVFSSIEKEGPSLRYLDAGILISLGSLFYNNLIFFLPFFLISQFTLKQFNWKEFLYPIIGMIVPFIYIFSGYFLFSRPIIPDLKSTFQQIFFDKSIINYSWPFLTGIGIYAAIMIVANLFAIKKFASSKIQSRNLYQMIFYLFLIGILIFIFIPSSGLELFYLLSIPSSVLLSIYFTECRNNFINRALLLILILDPLVVNIVLALK